MKPPFSQWPRTYGGPAGTGRLKSRPRDFQVVEQLGFEPGGGGEHVYLWVEKTGLNTEQLAAEFARFAGVSRRRVGYAGLKDKQALTRQWFCVHLPGKQELPWEECRGDGFRILRWLRHPRKLQRGALAGNRFQITLRQFEGDRRQAESILEQLSSQGFANYFGPQRFGHQGANVAHAVAMFEGREKVRNRHLRGLYLSAARALIFNQVLDYRVREGNWHIPLPGDLLMFDGGGAFFRAETLDDDIVERVRSLTLHPSGPLWGDRGELASAEAGEIERSAAGEWQTLARGLEREGLRRQRRPLRVQATDLSWSWQGDSLRLEFFLPAGVYATTLLREIIATEESDT